MAEAQTASVPSSAPPVLELRDLHARYGPVPVVRGISLTVGSGEIVGLIGPNGVGKTTTLLAVMSAVPFVTGQVLLDGVSIVGRTPERAAREGVALVPEGRQIFAGLTVEENLRLGLAGRRSRDRLAEDLDWIRSLFPVVAEFASRQAGALSGGQQQQLAIARGLCAAPRVLLLDEPSLGLAPSVIDTVLDALTQIRARGIAILLVEQRAQLIASFADRTHVLNNGELRMTLTRDDAADTDKMIAAYMS